MCPYSLGFHSLENPWKHSSLSYNPTPPKSHNIFFLKCFLLKPYFNRLLFLNFAHQCCPTLATSLWSRIFWGYCWSGQKKHTHINCFDGSRVSPYLSFFLNGSTAVTYIFTAPTCTATIIPLEPCALNAGIQHFILRFNKKILLYRYHLKRGCISHWDLIKFPYFTDIT